MRLLQHLGVLVLFFALLSAFLIVGARPLFDETRWKAVEERFGSVSKLESVGSAVGLTTMVGPGSWLGSSNLNAVVPVVKCTSVLYAYVNGCMNWSQSRWCLATQWGERFSLVLVQLSAWLFTWRCYLARLCGDDKVVYPKSSIQGLEIVACQLPNTVQSMRKKAVIL